MKPTEIHHKAGFVNIFGNPNVGKSTLMNAMVGERLSIITPKAQTTRHRILGILNTEDYQMVFSDTPGVLEPSYALQEFMMDAVFEALEDADIALYLVEANEKRMNNEKVFEALKNLSVPLFLVINKIDLSDQKGIEENVQYWQSQFPRAEVWLISALHGFNIPQLRDRLLELLPISPPYYEKDAITDRPERFFVSEVIREKILLHYKKEIPYSVEVVVDSFKEEESIIRIHTFIYVERDTQKSILIGKNGEALKRVGVEARADLEKFFQKHIHLDTFVKVDKNWRKNKSRLKKYGYNR